VIKLSGDAAAICRCDPVLYENVIVTSYG
jgi:hypothetical protein